MTTQLSPQITETADVVGLDSHAPEAERHGGWFALRQSTMVFESLLAFPRALVSENPDTGSSTLALDGREGDVYNEEAFQHFLEVERTRAKRSARPCLLLLV